MTLTRSLRALCFLILAAAATGCVRFSYSWLNIQEPIEQARIDELGQELAAGAVPLQACLDELGAPVLVWETHRGLALAYGWRDEGSWTLHIGYTWQFIFRAQIDYSSTAANLQGLVLWFDDDLQLVALKRGRLRELVRTERQPTMPELRLPDGDL